MPLIKNTGTCREGDVRKRAFEIYLERTSKGVSGDEKQDWLQAERDIDLQAQLYRQFP